MAATYPDIGHGITFAFTANTALNALKMVDYNWSGGEVETVDVTDYSVAAVGSGKIGNRKRIAVDDVDPGIFTLKLLFNPDVVIPHGTNDTLTITWRDGGTWAIPCIIGNSPGSFPRKEAMTIDLPCIARDEITVTPAA